MQTSDVRALLPDIDAYAYFQTSGFSPKPEPVIDEVVSWLRFQARGPALPQIHDALAEVVETTRARVAQAIAADRDEIMLAENATVGINIVASGIEWQPGDGVVLSNHEHPGNRVVWYAIAQRYGVRLHFLDIDGDDDQLLLDSLERLLEQQIRLVSISHVSRRSGRRLPARSIAELAHRHNVSVLLDGAQAFGSVPVDTRELGCDFYVLSGHKYILGPQATGAFYLRRERIETLKPSWLGSRSQQWMDLNGGLVLHESARRYEFGTRNMADIAGFGAALAMWESIGWGAVFAAIAEYAAGMRAALAHVPGLLIETPKLPAQGSGIVTFRMPGITGHELYTRLLEHERILVSPFEPGTESVRVSTHVFNTEAERERLVAALSAVGQTHRRGDK